MAFLNVGRMKRRVAKQSIPLIFAENNETEELNVFYSTCVRHSSEYGEDSSRTPVAPNPQALESIISRGCNTVTAVSPLADSTSLGSTVG